MSAIIDQNFNPRIFYAPFYQNPVIQRLSANPRWTISGRLPTTPAEREAKAPINIRELSLSGMLYGARPPYDESCLMTLDELTNFLPTASNCAYFLDTIRDGVIALDIEKTCPPHIRDHLLTLPTWYTEVSLSGLGYHLLAPLPANFQDFPDVLNAKNLQSADRTWEIHLCHWLTFTRNAVDPTWLNHHLANTYYPDRAGNLVSPLQTPTTWEDVFGYLASNYVPPVSAGDIDFADLENSIPNHEMLLNLLCSTARYNRTLADFNYDHSRYEFGYLSHLHKTLLQHAENNTTVMASLTNYGTSDGIDPSIVAYIIYEALTMLIPFRVKHSETRNGVPLLLDAARRLVSFEIAKTNEM